jgi:dihydrodipicolinate synthase/N-acetylneuraminate lyase
MGLLELTGGGRHARSFGGMKAALTSIGVIAHPTLASPLHTPTSDEVATVGARAKELGVSIRA